MANHISHASLPYPVKNARYTLLVPYLDADGDPTDPTTPDTEVSQDGGAFADAAEEVTTISGSNGAGFITLTGAETNNSGVFVAFKVASGPKATLMTLYPRVLPILENGTAQAGAAGSITLATGAAGYDLSGAIVRTTGGTGGGGTGGANNQARVITAYNTSTKVATVTPNWETNPDGTTTYDILVTETMAACAKSNVTHINGGATDGNNATLSLKALNITNSAGNALHVESTGGNGHGLYAKGAGTGSGLSANGGSTSSGMIAQGGSTSGAGLQLSGVGSSPGLDVAGGATGRGISAIGNDTQAGIYASNNATGQGVDILGGSTSGEGLRVRSNSGNGIAVTSLAGNGHAMTLQAHGTGEGLRSQGGATGNGMELVGGSTSGEGLTVTNTSGNAVSFTASGGNGHGFVVSGNGSGAGFRTVAGATGAGTIFVGGSTSGEGFSVSATSGNAVSFATAGGNGHGFLMTAHGTGAGLRAVAGATGTGILGVGGSTSGNGVAGQATLGFPISQAMFQGEAQAGSDATSVVLSTLSPANDDLWNGLLVVMATGTSAGQARLITDYDGTTKRATITPPWDSAAIPASGDHFGLVHWGASSNEPITSPVQHNGTAQAGGATTITLAATASATNDLYNGQVIKIYGDPSTSQGAGQARVIIDYNGGTKQATVDRAWVTNPNNTSTYSILATSAPALDATLHGVNVSAGGIASTAFAADAITASAIAADAIGSSELAATAATEIATAVWAETMTEVASPPAITGTLKAAISWLFALGKNKRTTTASTETLRNDADSGSLGTASVSDDGTTFTRNKWS